MWISNSVISLVNDARVGCAQKGLLELPAETVRARLEDLAAALQLDLTLTAKLIGKVKGKGNCLLKWLSALLK